MCGLVEDIQFGFLTLSSSARMYFFRSIVYFVLRLVKGAVASGCFGHFLCCALNCNTGCRNPEFLKIFNALERLISKNLLGFYWKGTEVSVMLAWLTERTCFKLWLIWSVSSPQPSLTSHTMLSRDCASEAAKNVVTLKISKRVESGHLPVPSPMMPCIAEDMLRTACMKALVFLCFWRCRWVRQGGRKRCGLG